MTSTIEGAFGSQLIANGYFLNNELTDFTFAPERDGAPVANRVEGGKRPLSSMSPTIVYDASGKPRSEEHTPELQFLMRISYAVFCLQKKTKKQKLQETYTTTITP